jgi:hypothetical protein
MTSTTLNDRELRLTAALYFKVGGESLLQHVKATGLLPETFEARPHFVIPMRLLIEERGTDITLTLDEKLIYDAILKEKTIKGVVRLVSNEEDKNNDS